MTRLAATASAVLLVLVLAPAAQAKDIVKLAVCGPGGCADRTGLVKGSGHAEEVLAGNPVSAASVQAHPYVRVKVGLGAPGDPKVFGRMTLLFVPRTGMVQGEDGLWSTASPPGLRVLRAAAQGVRRYPAAGLHVVPTPQPVTPPVPAAAKPEKQDSGGAPIVPASAAVLVVAGLALGLLRRRHPRV